MLNSFQKCKNCEGKIEQIKYNYFCSRQCYLEYSTVEKKCEYCQKLFQHKRRNKRRFCSNQCASLGLSIIKKETRKNTFLQRYGVEHQSQIPHVKKKIREKRERGVYNNMVIRQKETLLKKYGSENAFRFGSKEFKDNLKQKYGNKFFNNRPKMIQTNLEKYGQKVSPNTVQSTTKRSQAGEIGFKSKKFQNFLDNKGVENVSQLSDVKIKKQKTKLISTFNNIKKRCKNIVKPLFSLELFDSVKYYNKKYPFQCLKCNATFEDTLYSGKIPRCLICYPFIIKSTSNSEKEIAQFLQGILPNEEIQTNIRTMLRDNRELDIYIPSKKIAIEYNGLYWHGELNGKDKNYHINKTMECNKKGVRLIQIFEDEWVYKQEIVKNRLKHILGVISIKIYARNCNIKEISAREKNEFLNNVHIQGEDKSGVKLGAFHDNELVSLFYL